MRSLLVIFLLVSTTATPCYAGKNNKVVLDVRGDLQISSLYEFDKVYERFTDVLQVEGLEHLISKKKSDDCVDENEDEDDDDYDYDQASSEMESGLLNQSTSTQVNHTSKELNQALKKEFMKRKLRAMKWELATGSSPVVCDLGFNSIAAWTGCLGPFGGGMALVKVMTGVRDLSRELLKAVGAIYDDAGTDPLTKYELKYAKRKRFLPLTQQEAIENLIQAAYTTEKGQKEALDKLPQLLRLPTHSIEPSPNFIEPIEKLTQGFQVENGEEFTEPLLRLLAGHYARYQPTAGTNPLGKYIICLEGPAGIGKTNLVQGIAKSLELQFIKVSLSGGPKRVFGDKQNPGTLLQALSSGSKLSKNLVILFDEADHTLNGKPEEMTDWLQFFDPKSPGFYSAWADADIDLSHALFFIACNSPIKNDALRDRMTRFALTAPTKEQKQAVLEGAIIPSIGKSANPLMEINSADLPEGIAKRMLSKDSAPGFRGLERMTAEEVNAVRLSRLRSLNRSTAKDHEE